MRVQSVIRDTVRHPAIAGFLALWGGANAILVARGHAETALQSVLAVGVVAGLGLVTVRALRSVRPPEEPTGPPPATGGWRVVQLVFLLAVLGLLIHDSLAFHGVAKEAIRIPIWSDAVSAVASASRTALGDAFGTGRAANMGANTARYLLLPLVGLLILGARPRELGLRMGRGSLRVTAIWCALPAAAVTGSLVTGASTASGLALLATGNLFQNGLAEEFFFRGALLARLERETDATWALVLSSLAFAALHLGLAWTLGGTADPWIAASTVIALHGVMGLGFGFLFVTTRSLLAPTVFHVLVNTMMA